MPDRSKLLPVSPLNIKESGVCRVRVYSNSALMDSTPSSFKGTKATTPATCGKAGLCTVRARWDEKVMRDSLRAKSRLN